MTCSWQETDVWRYYDQEMESGEQTDFVAHLATCSVCQNEMKQLEAIGQTLRETHASFTESNKLDGLEKRVMEISLTHPKPFGQLLDAVSRFGPYRALATAAMFMIVLSSFWFYQGNPLNSPGEGMTQDLAQVDYFYSNTDNDILYFDLDPTIKVIWVLESD